MTALEVATLQITPGQEDAFVATYQQARHLLTDVDSCRSVRMTRGVERPSTFVLLVEWDSVEAHERDFRATERWVQWRDAIGPHFSAPPDVVHYLDV